MNSGCVSSYILRNWFSFVHWNTLKSKQECMLINTERIVLSKHFLLMSQDIRTMLDSRNSLGKQTKWSSYSFHVPILPLVLNHICLHQKSTYSFAFSGFMYSIMVLTTGLSCPPCLRYSIKLLTAIFPIMPQVFYYTANRPSYHGLWILLLCWLKYSDRSSSGFIVQTHTTIRTSVLGHWQVWHAGVLIHAV